MAAAGSFLDRRAGDEQSRAGKDFLRASLQANDEPVGDCCPPTEARRVVSSVYGAAWPAD